MTTQKDKFKITIEGQRSKVIASLADQPALDAYLATCVWSYCAPGVEQLFAKDGYTPISLWDRDLTYRADDGRELAYGVVVGANRRKSGVTTNRMATE